jgi:hypothetical protein
MTKKKINNELLTRAIYTEIPLFEIKNICNNWY